MSKFNANVKCSVKINKNNLRDPRPKTNKIKPKKQGERGNNNNNNNDK